MMIHKLPNPWGWAIFGYTKTPSGKPELCFHGRAKDAFAALGADTAHLSISHGRDSSIAVVILEKNNFNRQETQD